MEQAISRMLLCPGKASFIIGGQWGSEGKGASASVVAAKLARLNQSFDIITTNAGAQAGHTSVHNGVQRVAFHLPTAALIQYEEIKNGRNLRSPAVYLNGGSIIDPVVLEQELATSNFDLDKFYIHPNAAVITDECRAAEGRSNSAQTAIASTRKGVGEALSRKILRSGMIAKDHPFLSKFTKQISLNHSLNNGLSVLVEVPQGISLSIDSHFYPHTTSRNCTVGQAMADAGIHPSFVYASMLTLRTFPIRVGNIVEDGKTLGMSGSFYPDQEEISWDILGQKPEITTVTKRVRRVFTFSIAQAIEAIVLTRPSVVHLTFCDYLKSQFDAQNITNFITRATRALRVPSPLMLYQYGPSTDDVYLEPR